LSNHYNQKLSAIISVIKFYATTALDDAAIPDKNYAVHINISYI